MAIGFLPGYGRQSALIGQMQADPLQTGLISPAVLAAMGEPQGKVRVGLLSPDTWNRIGDGLAGAENTGADRRALLGQALLAASAGMMQTGGQGTAAALGNGIAAGLNQLNTGRKELAADRYRQQAIDRQLNDPAGLREFNELTRIASDPNETPERRQAASVRLGMTGRASSAGFGFGTFTDAGGNPRPQRNNPNGGGIEIWYDEQQRWVPLGGQSYTPAAPVQQAANGEQVRIDPSVPAWLRDQILANPDGGEYHQPGTFAPAPVAGLGRGRSKEAEAAAVASAQRGVELATLPAELSMRTGAAVDQAGRVTAANEAAKGAADATQGLPKIVQQADEAIDAITKLEDHPGLPIITGLSGWLDPRNYIRGTDAQGAQALADQVQGQVFLTAFESLKGGGQITEVEGKKAEAAKARLNTAQNERDYRAALADLSSVVKSGRQRAIRQAGGAGRPATGRTIMRTGTMNGRRVVQYSDGSVEYAD